MGQHGAEGKIILDCAGRDAKPAAGAMMTPCIPGYAGRNRLRPLVRLVAACGKAAIISACVVWPEPEELSERSKHTGHDVEPGSIHDC